MSLAKDFTDIEQAAAKRANKIIIIVVVILIAVFIYRVYKGARAGANAIGDAMGEELLSVQTGVPVTRIKWLRDMASKLNDAVTHYYAPLLYDYCNIDEDAWISILTQLQTVNECTIISTFYREMKTKTGNSLRYDVDDAFDPTEKARISRVYPYLR